MLRTLAVAAFGLSAAAVAWAATPPAMSEISLSRHGCYGACPADSITIYATGAVEYVGFAHTPKLGRYRGRVDNATYARVVAMTNRAKLFTLSAMYGGHYEEAPTYDVSARRGGAAVRVDVNDPTGAPRPLRDLAGLLSKIRDATSLTSESQVNTVVGSFYGLAGADQELYVDIGMTDDTVFRDREYTIAVGRRIVQPCNDGEPKIEESPLSAVVVDAAGAITGAGYAIRPTAKGIEVANARETIELERVRYSEPPDLPLKAAASDRCPTNIEIRTGISDVTDAKPVVMVVSNLELDIASVVSRAHFQCDAQPGRSIGVETRDSGPLDQQFQIELAAVQNLAANTPCRLIVDAGAKPKGGGEPAAAAESATFYYVPNARAR